MQYCSRPIDSEQDGIHHHLQGLLARHSRHSYKRPLSHYSQQIFLQAEQHRRQSARAIILDSGCASAESSRELARRFPQHLVVGVDKSAHRLRKAGLSGDIQLNGNCLLVRMNLVDFWRLAVLYGWRLHRHYLLYPNPWPKPAQLARRWHAHPVFPYLLALGGELEMRCTWRVYAEEFQLALNFLFPDACDLESFAAESALSRFELKYSASGHRLYRCRAKLDHLAGFNQFSGSLQPELEKWLQSGPGQLEPENAS